MLFNGKVKSWILIVVQIHDLCKTFSVPSVMCLQRLFCSFWIVSDVYTGSCAGLEASLTQIFLGHFGTKGFYSYVCHMMCFLPCGFMFPWWSILVNSLTSAHILAPNYICNSMWCCWKLRTLINLKRYFRQASHDYNILYTIRNRNAKSTFPRSDLCG